jgi:phosphatidylglycerol:prolipoprotein diacylglycerol transferase
VCQTLIFIPDRILGLPVFGLGWLLLFWGVASLIWVGSRFKAFGWSAETKEPLPFLGIAGIVIAFVLPMLEVKTPSGQILGLPIRGYGTLLLVAVVSGWGLAAWRATQRGLSVDTIASLGFWCFIPGIVGARLFFVVEYWPKFQRPTIPATLLEIVRFNEGGLVVYGSLIGGFLGFHYFAKRQKLPALALADVIAPGVVLGMAIGRLGCLMNGCCYGGLSEHGAWGIQFPRFSSVAQEVTSPPYSHQLITGRIHGFVLGENESGQPLVKSVEPGSQAERNGLTSGVRIAKMNGTETSTVTEAKILLEQAGPDISIELADGQRIKWSIGALPERSRPVHPAQIYSAISGVLICFVLLSSEPFFNRTGAVSATFLSLYPITRFLEEIIRDDEPAQLGTGLTVSQLVSVAVLVCAAATWVVVARNPGLQRFDRAGTH